MSQIQEKNTLFLKVLLLITTAILFLAMLSPMHVKAAESISWTALGNGVYQLDGTEIKAEVAPGTVHITGTGAIPDFDYWKLNKRPWSTCECQSVTIDDTITSIGAYVTKLKISTAKIISDVTMVFISLGTCLMVIHSLGSVGIGTIVAALLVGSEVKWITKIFGKSRDKMLGIHVEKICI